MLINLSPVRMEEQLVARVDGEVLYLNDEPFDFTPLLDGASIAREAIDSKWFAGPVERSSGVLSITLVLPHGPNAPETTRFPQPITVPGSGSIYLPVYDLEAIPVMKAQEGADQEAEQ